MGRGWWRNSSSWGWKKRSGGGLRYSRQVREELEDYSYLNRILEFDLAERHFGLGTSFGSLSQASQSVVIHDDDDDDDDDYEIGHDDLDDEICFGSVRGNIVGLQYYSGTVNKKEMVALEREPQNRYDINAIKVKNVGNVQVGHIKRELAKPMAFIMDKGLARLEGIVPFGAQNMYSMPVEITLWGKPEHQKAAVDKLKTSGFYLTGGTQSGASTETGATYDGASFSIAAPRRTYLTPAEVKNELDNLFENIQEGDKTSFASPADAIDTTLYPHQKQALNWMIKCENSSTLPPFWQERNGKYFNTVLNFTSNSRPESVRGGILADDMGLGKTLEMITLIVTNFTDNRPLAVPVEGLVRQSRFDRMASQKAKMLPKCDSLPVPTRRSQIKLEMGKSISCHTVKHFMPELSSPANVDVPLSMLHGLPEVEENFSTPDISDDDDDLSCSMPSIEGNTMVRTDDPDFCPVVKQKTRRTKGKENTSHVVMSASRPSRSVKRPARYIYSSGEDELINEETPRKKGKVNIVKKAVSIKTKGKTPVSGKKRVKKVRPRKQLLQDTGVLPGGVKEDGRHEVLKINPATGDNAAVEQQEVHIVEPVSDKNQPEVEKRIKMMSDRINELEILLQASQQGLAMQPSQQDLPTQPSQVGYVDPASMPVPVSSQSAPVASLAPDNKTPPCVQASLSDLPDLVKMEPVNTSTEIGGTCDKRKTDICVDELPDLDDMPSTVGDFPDIPVPSVSLTGDLPDIPVPSVTGAGYYSTDDYSICTDKVVPTNYTKAELKDVGESTGRTATTGPRCTLIVCPLSVLSNWLDQLEDHLHRNVHLSIYLYYGASRTKNINLLENQDVVITTYSTVSADFKKGARNPLKKVKWLRIVLDEGHAIKNPSAQQTKAILELDAQRKWVLTGTPIQNSMKDLWSLINFLKVNPFTDRQWWRRTIERPLEKGDESALKRVQHLMGHLALRRTKTQEVNGKPLVELPARQVYIEHVKLSEEERQMYESMQNEGRIIVSKYFKQGTLLHHYGDVLAILMRLRQLCCHPFLVAKATQAVKDTLADISRNGGVINDELRQKLIDTLIMVLSSGTDEECAICLESLNSPVITHCAHVFCRPCIQSVIKNERPSPKCPLCRGTIEENKLLEVPPEEIQDDGQSSSITADSWKSSAKADALMNALLQLRSEDLSIKSLVVSQFTSLLTLLEIPLRTNGFQFVRLDGTMTIKARTRAIEEFSDPSAGTPTIFLLSLKAGGVGINLTAASRVFLIDPAWNPASEEQCFDRCHRLGQTRDVVITKFIVEDSVEERMMELQEKKRQLMQGAFGQKQSVEQKRQSRIRDIKTLLAF